MTLINHTPTEPQQFHYATEHGLLTVSVTSEGVIFDLYPKVEDTEQDFKTWGMMAEEWAEWLLVNR